MLLVSFGSLTIFVVSGSFGFVSLLSAELDCSMIEAERSDVCWRV